MSIKETDIVAWGKEFHVTIEYSESIKSTECAKVEQEVHSFILKSNDILQDNAPQIAAYVKRTTDAIGAVITGLFSDHITPQMLLVNNSSKDIDIALLCGYTYDREHGIALIYRNHILVKIGSQDIVSYW